MLIGTIQRRGKRMTQIREKKLLEKSFLGMQEGWAPAKKWKQGLSQKQGQSTNSYRCEGKKYAPRST